VHHPFYVVGFAVGFGKFYGHAFWCLFFAYSQCGIGGEVAAQQTQVVFHHVELSGFKSYRG